MCDHTYMHTHAVSSLRGVAFLFCFLRGVAFSVLQYSTSTLVLFCTSILHYCIHCRFLFMKNSWYVFSFWMVFFYLMSVTTGWFLFLFSSRQLFLCENSKRTKLSIWDVIIVFPSGSTCSMYVCVQQQSWYLAEWASTHIMVANPAPAWLAEQGKRFIPCCPCCSWPRIWFRETGSAVTSRVSPLILHTQIN